MKKIVYRSIEAFSILLTTSFCMATGAACYHQYQVLSNIKNTHKVVHITDVIDKSEDDSKTIIFGEQTIQSIPLTVLDYEDIEEEKYYDSLELMAICIEAEAGNQGLEGKRLVADVILNRVDSPDFPNSITEVITQPYHFSSYWNGAMELAVPTDETFEAVRLELDHRTNSEILYFTAGEWSKYGTKWKQIGDHYFSVE